MRKLSAPSISIRSAVSAKRRPIVLLSIVWPSAFSPYARSPSARVSIIPGRPGQPPYTDFAQTNSRAALHSGKDTSREALLITRVGNLIAVGRTRTADLNRRAAVFKGTQKALLALGGGVGACSSIPIADDCVRLRAFLAFNDVELNIVAFLQCLVSIPLN